MSAVSVNSSLQPTGAAGRVPMQDALPSIKMDGAGHARNFGEKEIDQIVPDRDHFLCIIQQVHDPAQNLVKDASARIDTEASGKDRGGVVKRSRGRRA